jgi:hypothetical protein
MEYDRGCFDGRKELVCLLSEVISVADSHIISKDCYHRHNNIDGESHIQHLTGEKYDYR